MWANIQVVFQNLCYKAHSMSFCLFVHLCPGHIYGPILIKSRKILKNLKRILKNLKRSWKISKNLDKSWKILISINLDKSWKISKNFKDSLSIQNNVVFFLGSVNFFSVFLNVKFAIFKIWFFTFQVKKGSNLGRAIF